MTRRKPPANVIIYYAREHRSWYAYVVDAENNQIGESVNAYSYNDCLDCILQREQG